MRRGGRGNLSRLAEFPVGRVVLELQREQHQGQPVEFGIHMGAEIGITVMLAGKFIGADGDEISHARRENRKFGCHAVFYRLVFRHSPGIIYSRQDAGARVLAQLFSLATALFISVK